MSPAALETQLDQQVREAACSLLKLLRDRIHGCPCVTDPQFNADGKRVICEQCGLDAQMSMHAFDFAALVDDDPWWITAPLAEVQPAEAPRPRNLADNVVSLDNRRDSAGQETNDRG